MDFMRLSSKTFMTALGPLVRPPDSLTAYAKYQQPYDFSETPSFRLNEPGSRSSWQLHPGLMC